MSEPNEKSELQLQNPTTTILYKEHFCVKK